MMHKQIWKAAAVAAVVWLAASAPAAVVYTNDFSAAEVGKAPADFMILDGQFTVQEFEGNRVLELPGAPLDTFGILFGPTEAEGLSVSARVQGTATGRRLPSFGVALNGVAGYKLMVSAGKRVVELNRGEETLTTVPYQWKSGQWVWMKLQVTKVKEGAWQVAGKVWPAGEAEPTAWTVTVEEKAALAPGRPSVWGIPYATTPIRFDDVKVEKVP